LVLKSYKLSFSGRLSKPTYFDESKDILAFRNRPAWRAFSSMMRFCEPTKGDPVVRFLVLAFDNSTGFMDGIEDAYDAISYTDLETMYIKAPPREWELENPRHSF
jgi:hypothetical protein